MRIVGGRLRGRPRERPGPGRRLLRLRLRLLLLLRRLRLRLRLRLPRRRFRPAETLARSSPLAERLTVTKASANGSRSQYTKFRRMCSGETSERHTLTRCHLRSRRLSGSCLK
mgnify:CR=1 FL=1